MLRFDEGNKFMSQSETRVNFEINIHYSTSAKSFPMVTSEPKQQKNPYKYPLSSQKNLKYFDLRASPQNTALFLVQLTKPGLPL